MKPQPYRQVLRAESDRAQALRVVESRRIDEHPQELVLRTYVPDHSGAQQRFYRVICRELGEHLGYEPDEMAETFKRRHMPPILWADPKKTRFHAIARELAQVEADHGKGQAGRLRSLFVSMLSTTELNLTQMTEYLERCLKDAAEQGCIIETPEELRHRRETTTDKRKNIK